MMVNIDNRAFTAALISTTQAKVWQPSKELVISERAGFGDVMVLLDHPKQTIDGFGACFNELGWEALNALEAETRENIFRELFAPGVGTNFTICRMPLGANDFSRDWYSYDEIADDFTLEHFMIENDLETLIPFIHRAQHHQPSLKLWASPWSPPTWMKYNKHYAAALPWPGSNVENGLRPDQVGKEGTDMFIQEEPYFHAYANYFGRFIDAYQEQGIQLGSDVPKLHLDTGGTGPIYWLSRSGDGTARCSGFLRHTGTPKRETH
jgi:glucosylceramidase